MHVRTILVREKQVYLIITFNFKKSQAMLAHTNNHNPTEVPHNDTPCSAQATHNLATVTQYVAPQSDASPIPPHIL